ncbi:MAG: hypothetical protein ABI171_19650 [Collimonas sp.]|uniref:hypothetical protein n=1 Tax=Collimonas sp. TaxID=1963772 RepID=UPI003266BC19
MKWRRFFFSSEAPNNIGDDERLRIWYFWVIGIFAAWSLLLLFGPKLGADKAVREEILSEFHRIQPFPEGYSYDLKITDKIGVLSMATKYLARVPQEKVLYHYREQLLKNGWIYHSDIRSIYDNDFHGEDYCKRGVLGSIEFMSDENRNESYYVFSLALRDGMSGCK